jgi:hypothetical protein
MRVYPAVLVILYQICYRQPQLYTAVVDGNIFDTQEVPKRVGDCESVVFTFQCMYDLFDKLHYSEDSS